MLGSGSGSEVREKEIQWREMLNHLKIVHFSVATEQRGRQSNWQSQFGCHEVKWCSKSSVQIGSKSWEDFIRQGKSSTGGLGSEELTLKKVCMEWAVGKAYLVMTHWLRAFNSLLNSGKIFGNTGKLANWVQFSVMHGQIGTNKKWFSLWNPYLNSVDYLQYNLMLGGCTGVVLHTREGLWRTGFVFQN